MSLAQGMLTDKYLRGIPEGKSLRQSLINDRTIGCCARVG